MRENWIRSLSNEEFDNLAKQQVKMHPHLLKITDEETIIDSFYDYYERICPKLQEISDGMD